MTKKTALLTSAAIVATLAGVAVADICTYGSKNYDFRVIFTGNATDWKPSCAYKCPTNYDITVKDTREVYRKDDTWQMECKFHIHGTYTYENGNYFISQDFGWTKVPLNQSCSATARAATVECKL
jgi:hypothetical protein